MTLPPHLHLLIPSSSPSTLLEARLYLPSGPCGNTSGLSPWIRTSRNSEPVRYGGLQQPILGQIGQIGIERLITAVHPWGRMGGNMLDPVLTQHLLSAAVYDDLNRSGPTPDICKTAVITYNARGVGVSQGSSAWFTPGNDPADFAAVEAWAIGVLGGSEVIKDIRRFGYSWGCMAATLAPLPSLSSYTITSLMLVSPTITFLPALTYFSGSFNTTLSSLLDRGVKVWTIYGDSDQFTGAGRYRTWVESMESMERLEVVGDHFWRGESGGKMREWFASWLKER